jgi:NAD(P)-dependent dehydrogenase (short-subunit alcohol dehydrogenase family)
MSSEPLSSTVLLIGVTGTIGSAVKAALEARGHRVIGAAYGGGDHRVDLGDPDSIKALFEAVGPVDAIVSTAGRAPFGRLDDIDDAGWSEGLGNKLLGQVNLVRFGRSILRSGGSVTLTSGVLAESPNPGSTVLSLTNAGLQGFVGAAATQTTDSQRVSVVSPPLVRETAMRMGWGAGGMPAVRVAAAYVEAVEGSRNGETIRPGELDVR